MVEASRSRISPCVVRLWRRFALPALVGALLVLVAPAGAAARPLITGVSGMSEDDPIAFQRTAAAGTQLVDKPLGWGSVAPAEEPSDWDPTDPGDPNYNWASTDLWVTRAVQAGLDPFLIVDGAPSWAQRCQAPAPLTGRLCDPDPAKLVAFATAAARRYSGYFQGLPRVRFWQGMNEPNLSLFFNPQFKDGRPASPTLYRALINAFYAAVKSVDPSNTVIAAGLGPIGRGRWAIAPMRFARLLLCMNGRRDPHPTRGNCGGGVHFDVFDMHPYTTGGPTHVPRGGDDVALGNLAKLQELLTAADRAGRIKGRYRRTPLWITEFSWDSKPPDPGGVSMPILARWTSEALYQAWSAGISRFFWFSLRDFPSEGAPFSETVQSGLYFRGPTLAEDKPKRSLYAFRFPFVATSQKTGISFWGRTPTSSPGRVIIQVRDLNGWRTAAVARANRAGIFQGVVKTTYGRNKRGYVRARYRREAAIPFSLKPVKDFYQPPFG